MPALSATVVKRDPIFPLSVSSRYLQTAGGKPFLLFGEAAWLLEVQCTQAQTLQYLDNRRNKGFTAILVECMESTSSAQTPVWQNANGDIPFTTTSPTGTTSWNSRINAYWNQIDWIVNQARQRGMAVVLYPAYLGFPSAGEGWTDSINLASNADLQDYGTFLGARYRQGNVIWAMGGDDSGSTALRDKQWNIMLGIRTANPNVIICGHQLRTDSDGYTYWGPGGQNYAGWNLNTIYTSSTDIPTEAATAYGRTGPYPFVNLEAVYEDQSSPDTNTQIQQAMQGYLSGACGYFFGTTPVWSFGSPATGGAGAASVIANNLNSPAAVAMDYIQRLLRAYAWWKLVPKTDTSVTTTTIGTGAAALCPAAAADGTLAMVFVNTGASFTFVRTCMSGTFNARWVDVSANVTNIPAEGGSFTNIGTQAFAYPGANSAGGTAWVFVAYI